MLMQTCSAWAAPGCFLAVVVGWSRVELRDRTCNQVIAGTIVTAAVR
ncbi:hypothetical protein ACVW19_006722 [Streptomyces sp. TE5632]